MENPQLSTLFKIDGVGAASGLFYKDKQLFIISDNSSFLYNFNTQTALLDKIPLADHIRDSISKAKKPDFEALAFYNDSLYLFGSGSKERRNRLFRVDALTKQLTDIIDLTDLYKAMQESAQLAESDFNIEAALFDGSCWLLFNRGNKSSNKNIIFTIDDITLNTGFKINYFSYNLPEINKVSSSFTDAVILEGKIYFLAAAEDTASTFFDGDIAGSLIGRIDRRTMALEWTNKISDDSKYEGITLYSNTEDKLEFLICEDNDTEEMVSVIYKLFLEKVLF